MYDNNHTTTTTTHSLQHTHKYSFGVVVLKVSNNRMGWNIIYSKKTCLHGHQKTSLSLIWQLIIYAVNSNSVHTWVNLPNNISLWERKFQDKKIIHIWMEYGDRVVESGVVKKEVVTENLYSDCDIYLRISYAIHFILSL